MEYIIRDRESLEKLNSKNLKNSIRTIKLDIGDSTIAKVYEQKLNKSFFACGCQEGAMAVYATLFGGLIVWLSGNFTFRSNWWLLLIALAIASVSGKIFGLLLSKHKLNKTLADLRLILKESD